MEDSKGKIGVNLGGLDECDFFIFFLTKSILVSKLAAPADVKYWMFSASSILCYYHSTERCAIGV